MRLFLCSFLGPDNQDFYASLVGDLAQRCHGVLKPVPKDSAHVTYAFIEQADTGDLESTVQAASAVAAACVAVPIRLGGPQILFARREARLVMAEVVMGDSQLARMAADLRAGLERLLPGVSVSGRNAPHVTLARFKRATQRRAAAHVAEVLSHMAGTERDEVVTSVQVVCSALTPAGPRYEIKASLSLR